MSDVSKTNEALLAKVMDTLAYYQCRANNPKADHPIQGYHAFSEEQRDHLREKQREGAEEIVRMFAATRVPVQGEPSNRENCPGSGGHAGCGTYCMVCDLLTVEPNDDREALAGVEAELAEWLSGKRSWCDQHHGKPDEIELTAKADEATIRLLIVKRDALRATVPDAATDAGRWHLLYEKGVEERVELRAECDAALAAVERVRAIADQWDGTPDYLPSEYDRGRVDQRHDMTEQILAALDGAPEPEVKP